MRCTFFARGALLSPELEAEFERRLWFSLGRFSSRVTRVAVHFEDVNGPRSGPDKQCRIVANLGHSGDVTAEALEASWGLAVTAASERLARAVARKLERRREWQGSGHAASAAAVAGRVED